MAVLIRTRAARARRLLVAARNAASRKARDAQNRNIEFRREAKLRAERVNRRLRTAAARQVAVMPAETMPVFVAAVIADATAWEIHDIARQ